MADTTDETSKSIKADVSPVQDVWFKDLRRTLTRAFPHLFLTGRGVANNLTPVYMKHLLKFYDGRYEQDAEFVTTMFSLKMLSTTMVQGFRMRSSNPGLLREMGKLINGGHLRELLNEAKASEEKMEKLQRLLERYFGVFAGNTPFSALTMSRARGRMRGTRLRRNVGSQFITGAPPEHEDSTVLRLGVLMNPDKQSVMVDAAATNGCGFNRRNCPMASVDWSLKALKPFLLSDPNARIVQADRSPGLVALFFENQINIITKKVLLCPLGGAGVTKSVRPQRGVCGVVSAVECVVQLQSNRTQRLHYHIIARPHVSNVRLFEMCAANDGLTRKVQEFLDSVSRCALPKEAHDWWESQAQLPFEDRRRTMAFVPIDPRHSYEDYVSQGAKKIAMFQHEHAQTCTKTYRGKYMCRLGLGRPINEGPSAPKITELVKKSNISKGEHGQLKYSAITRDVSLQLSRRLSFAMGEFTRPCMKWPILWISHRSEQDGMVSEHNPILAAEMATSHNNQIASSNAGAENVDEYVISYVTPKNEYRNGDSQFHFMCVAALDNMEKYPTQADDVATDASCRAARTFGMKVVNSVVGSTEFSLPLMCYSCLGHDAYESSEDHMYYYPSKDVTEMKRWEHGNMDGYDPDMPKSNNLITSLAALAQAHPITAAEVTEAGYAYTHTTLNAKGKKVVVTQFVTHAHMYATRPLDFWAMLSWEMLCVAQVVPRTRKDVGGAGCKAFNLSTCNPLKDTHVMVLRRRQKTPVVAEALPKYPGNRPVVDENVPENAAVVEIWEKEMDRFSKAMVPMFSPWSNISKCKYSLDVEGFTNLLESLNNSKATLQDKGRGSL